MDTLVPECHDKCSMSGKAKNEYDCLNGADGDQCCRWDDNLELKDCKADAVHDELYRAADACCDEATESCSDDGWPKSCNLGCASIMVPLMATCVSKFPALGLTASVAPLQKAVGLCPCVNEIKCVAAFSPCKLWRASYLGPETCVLSEPVVRIRRATKVSTR